MDRGNSIWAGGAYDQYKRVRIDAKKKIAFLRRAMRVTSDPELKQKIAAEIDEVKTAAEEKLRGSAYNLY